MALAVLVVLSLGPVTPLGAALSFLPGMGQGVTSVYAAQVDHPENISNVSDTLDDPTQRQFFSNGMEMYDSTTYWGSANDGTQAGLGVDPLNNEYMQLAPDQESTFGYVILQEKISATEDFHVQGYFKVDRLANDGGNDTGDWIGLVFLPVSDTSVLTNIASQGGGSLGINSIPNALGIGIDMHRNDEYQDPAGGPFAALRWTDSSGALQSLGDRTNLYSSGQDMRNWNPANIQYTVNYYYNNGDPYITITLTDGENDGHTWTASTLNAGGSTNRLYITPPEQGYFTVAMDGANGGSHQRYVASWGEVSGTRAYGTATVNYLVDPNVVSGGGQVAPSTTLKSNVNDTIVIRNTTPGAVGSAADVHTFDGSVPATAATQYQSGWHPTRSVSVNETDRSFLTMNIDSSQNVLNIYYAPDYQEARVVTDASDPLGARTFDTLAGTTGGTMQGWSQTDATLTRQGYTYLVTAPNGSTYPTLTAAQSAYRTFDATANGTNLSDSEPQVFTVSYSLAFQQAIVKGIANGVTTNIATYNNADTPHAPLEEGTSGALKSEVSDAALAKQGFDYTVTGPDSTTYPTMQAAWEANNTWDLTNNPAGATTDSEPQVFTVNYSGHLQTVSLVQASSDGWGPSGTLESANGTSGTKISFIATDAFLAVAGYTYVVEVEDSVTHALLGSYSTLQAALSAQPNYDTTNNPAPATTDAAPQTFRVVYTAGNATVNYHYVDEEGNTLKAATANQQVVNAGIDVSSASAIQGYVYKEVDAAASDPDLRVNADGTSLIVYVYEIDPAIIQAAEAAVAAADASSVANETTVQQAKTALEGVLAASSPTPTQLQDATTALNNAVATATTARNNALADAQQSITDATNSAFASDTRVIAAQQALQNMLDNPGTNTTQEISSAAAALDSAVAEAAEEKQDALDAANEAKDPANLTPVTHEPGVESALAALNAALLGGTASAITNAADALTSAVSDAKLARGTANSTASAAITSAQGSTAAQDSSVLKAITTLQTMQQAAAADSPDDLTANIISATEALSSAVTAAEGAQDTARTNANTALANTSPVTNEPGVASAITALQAVLGNTTATASQIQQAVDVLTAATQSARDDRTGAVDSANHALGHVTAIELDDEAVAEAKSALESILVQAAADNAAALTQQILDATKTLTQALASEDAEHAQAVSTATTLLANTRPVTYESAVAAAVTELNAIIASNETHTTEEIEDATAALQAALNTANGLRSTANTTANASILAAQESDVAGEQDVQDAITALQQAQAQAAADSQTVFTSTIAALTAALDNAVAQAEADRQALRTAATTAIANASPVSNETAVASSISNLNTVLAADSPPATDAEINAATQALNGVVKTAKTNRSDANTVAGTQITQAEASVVANETSVQQAIDALETVMASAAANDPTALTADILTAKDALAAAQSAAQTTRNQATNNANTGIGAANTSPVYNEPTVIGARDILQNMLDNPGNYTTEQISAATTALSTAASAAQTARDDARAAAGEALTDANASPVSNEALVSQAENTLQNLLKDSTATTSQIEAATTALDSAVSSATETKNQALDDASDAMSDAAAYTGDPKVAEAQSKLQDMVDNPNNYTTQQITDATATLNAAASSAAGEKASAVDVANQAMGSANTAPVSYEQDVIDAKKALQDVIDAPGATAENIRDATSTFNDAVAASKNTRSSAVDDASHLIGTVSASEVGQEPGVAAAITQLNNLMAQAAADNAAALTNGIATATQALQTAVSAAQQARDDARQAIADANNSTVPTDPSVIAAQEALDSLMDDPASSTQDILDATADLDAAVALAEADAIQEARDQAAAAKDPSATTPVSNEDAVVQARNTLDGVLADSNASAREIQTATDALTAATASSKTARTNANSAASAAIALAQASPDVNTVEVQQAITALQEKMTAAAGDSATDRTADIIAKTSDLLAVTDAADEAHAAARTAATELLANTAPVSHEGDVPAAKTDLQAVLSNTSATTQEIIDATELLQQALDAANDARTQAKDEASVVLSGVEGDAAVNQVPAVVNARAALEDAITQANSDSASVLTADIARLTDELAEAARDAHGVRNDAIAAATDAMQPNNTTPVTYEPEVVESRGSLTDLIDSTASTTNQINGELLEFVNTVQVAKDERADAVGDANDLMGDIANSDSALEPEVRSGTETLARTISQAEADDPGSLTSMILRHMSLLSDTHQTAVTTRDAATLALANAQASSNSDHPAVADATSSLQALLDDPTSSTVNIRMAISSLSSALESAQSTQTAQSSGGSVPRTGDIFSTLVGVGVMLGFAGIAFLVLSVLSRRKGSA